VDDVEGIVLAAGASRRLGRPKALLDFDGPTALELVLGALAGGGIDRGVVVVERRLRSELGAFARSNAWPVVENLDPGAGRLGSILVGLEATSPAADLLLWPVDRPLAAATTVAALVAARSEADESVGVIVPEAGGRRGHPLLLRSSMREVLRGADPDANLRQLIRDSGRTRLVVPIEDTGIHFDLDTAEDYERALAWWRAQD